jgi:AAA15 family ATPase/GTPase
VNIIKKITISKFRSIGEKEVIEPADFNVISGANDSGKSNYLKALNLFFNGETDFRKRYNSQDDFNKWFRDNSESGTRDIVIEIEFAKGKYMDRDGINDGFIAKKTFDTKGGTRTEFFKQDGKTEIKDNKSLSYKRANAIISEKIKFLYIPAIRDYVFQTEMRRHLLEIVNSADGRSDAGKTLEAAFEKVKTALAGEEPTKNGKTLETKGELKKLIRDTNENLKVQIRPEVNFATLLASLDFQTTGQVKTKAKRSKEPKDQPVNLRHRGDGIQMHFLSILLSFIAQRDTKHYYIWGYEEPKIALEFKRQFEFADLFAKNFCDKVQIFITTHSPAFIFQEGYEDKRRVYRVRLEQAPRKKRQIQISKISKIDEYCESLLDTPNSEALEREIWGISQGKISAALGSSLSDVIKHRHISNSDLEVYKNKLREATEEIKSRRIAEDSAEQKLIAIKKEIEGLRPPKIFICEDEDMVTTWTELFEKAEILEVKIFTSKGREKMDQEETISNIRSKSKTIKYNPLVFRQYDRDLLESETVTLLENALNKNGRDKGIVNYKAKFLPVCEVENFIVLAKIEETNISPENLSLVIATSYNKLDGMIKYTKKSWAKLN